MERKEKCHTKAKRTKREIEITEHLHNRIPVRDQTGSDITHEDDEVKYSLTQRKQDWNNREFKV